jgi:hypothetical protein
LLNGWFSTPDQKVAGSSPTGCASLTNGFVKFNLFEGAQARHFFGIRIIEQICRGNQITLRSWKARQKTLDAIVTLLVRRTGAGNLRLKEGLAFGLVLGSLICRAFPVNFVRDDVDIDVFNLNCVPTLQYKLGARTSL